MAAGSTYTKIASTTLGSGVSSYTFGSISGAYTDLRLIMSIYSQNGYAPWAQFNGDTGTNYSLTQMYGSGTTTGSNRVTNGNNIYLGEAFNSGFYPYFVDFQNYSNSTTYKTCIWRASTPANYVQQGVGLWRNTSAITSIKIGVDVGTLVTGCTLSLYGIAAA